MGGKRAPGGPTVGTKDDARVVVSLAWTNGRGCFEADGAAAVANRGREARAAGFAEALHAAGSTGR